MRDVMRLGASVVWVFAAACGGDPDGGRRGAAGGTAGAGGGLDAVDLSGDCATPNLTRACGSCGAGRQICTSARTWSACQCAERGAAPSLAEMPGASPADLLAGGVPEGNLDVGITFAWPEQDATFTGSCEAGRYEGSFDGSYTGVYFGGGLAAGWVPAVTVPIAGLDPLGGPGLVFDLAEEGNGEIFRITGGTFQGTTNGYIPFHARLEGSVDCSTGKLTADILDGEYEYTGQLYRYEGWMTADYEGQTHALINGRWEVWEPDTIPNGTGPMMSQNFGSGSWQAKWVP